MASRQHVLRSQLIWLSLFSLHIILATSAAVNPANAGSVFQPSSASNSTIFSDVFNATDSVNIPYDNFHCAGDRPWTASYKPSDCARALSVLHDMSLQYGDKAYSWPAIAARGKLKHEAINSPIRFRWSMHIKSMNFMISVF